MSYFATPAPSFLAKARAVGITPYMNFARASGGDRKDYFASFRMAMLAFAAFPNSLCETAPDLPDDTLMINETAEATLEMFVTEEKRRLLPAPLDQWSSRPTFVRSQWVRAKANESPAEKYDRRKDEASIPPVKAGINPATNLEYVEGRAALTQQRFCSLLRP